MTTTPYRFRFIVLILVCLLFSLPTAAQNEPRVPPSNDMFAGAVIVSAPFSQTVTGIPDATVQSGETQPCIGGIGEESVWYSLNAPAGVTLEVDTIGSNYDTVVSVWQETGVALEPADLTNVDCEDDGTGAAKLRYPVIAAGSYYVSISAVPSVPVRAPHSLSVSFSFDVPASLAPAGSDPAHAVPLKIGKTVTLSGMEYGAGHDPVVANPACAANTLQYPAWFKLTVPIHTQVHISARGSLFSNAGSFSDEVSLDIFPEVFVSVADDIACGVTTGANAASMSPTLAAGVYYVRALRVNTNTNAVGASRYKITVSLGSSNNLLVNPGFDNIGDPLLGWKVKNGTGDGVSDFITNAFFFSGGAGENSQLQQTVVISPPLPVDDNLTLLYTVAADGNPGGLPFILSLKLTFTDGTIRTVKSNELLYKTGIPEILTVLPKGTLSKIRIALKFKGTSGDLIVDNFDLRTVSYATREAESTLPLPLPPAR